MSIIFTTPIQEDKLRMAFNNDVIRFSGNYGTAPAARCEVSFAGFTVTLYPGPDGRFFFNFKPYVSAIINTRNFEDTLQTAIDGSDPDSFVYDSTNGTLLYNPVTFKIFYSDNHQDTLTVNLTWLAGVEQLGDYNTFVKTETYVLTPFKRHTADRYSIKYWQGYPFDVSFYSPVETLYIKNVTNLLSQAFNPTGLTFRLVFSDGDDDETLEDLLPLIEGYNNLRLMASESESVDDKFLIVDKVPYKCGVYFKWLNKYSGYSYWLFEDTAAIDRSTKQIGELDRDYSNLEDTFTRAIQIGKESQDTIKVITDLLTEDDARIVEGIIDSPKIYMFTGQPYSRNDYRDWIEVSLKTTNVRVKNFKDKTNIMAFDFELPQRYTQTL